MRTICVVGLILQLFTTRAQEDTIGVKPPFFNQVNVSMNYSDARWYDRGEGKTSVGAGIYRNHMARNNFQLRWGFELNRLRQVGVTPKWLYGTADKPFQSTITSLNLPVALKYSFGKKIKWVPEAGIYLEHNMSNRLTGNYTRMTGDSANMQEMKLVYNSRKGVAPLNYGASLGLGVAIPSGPYTYEIKADYKFGFRDIGLGDYDSPLYSRYFRLSVGMIFHHKQEEHVLTTNDSTSSWINEFSGSGNYNDIARYSGNENRSGFGFGFYHNSRELHGFSTNLGFEVNNTNYYGRLVPDHNHGMYWYSKMDASLTAFSIPFTLRYHIGNRFRVFPEVGVFADLNAKATGKGKTYSYSGTPPNVTILESDFYGSVALKRINYGLTAGLGFLIPIGENNILLKAEYRYGQLELTPDNFSRVGIYNRYYRFSAGYALDMKKKNKQKENVQLLSELRASVNYGGITQNAIPLNTDNYTEVPQIGFGIALYHGSNEKKNFQYLIGVEADYIRMKSENYYQRSYNGKTEKTENKSSRQSLHLGLNNILRYSIGQRTIKPFAQIGLAPTIKVMDASQDNYITTDLATGEIQHKNYNSETVKLFDFSLAPNLGVGFNMGFTKLDYLVVAEYVHQDVELYRNSARRPNYFRLSIGIRLHRKK